MSAVIERREQTARTLAAQGATAHARPVNVMTIDVEDYFHVSNFERVVDRGDWGSMESRVERNTDRLLEMFAETNVTATFFVLAWVAERLPALIARIATAGHEVASHGYGHRLVYDQSRADFRQDVRKAKIILEDTSGMLVEGYRAPSFSITRKSLWALDALAEEGYRYDSSIYPIRHDRYGIPGSPREPYILRLPSGDLVEVPGSTVQLASMALPIGGGAYFRLLPYRWTGWGIARVNRRERRSAVFYLHPWEIDPGQPRLPASALRRVRHYANLARTDARLGRLLREFPFGPMRTLVDATRADPATPTSSIEILQNGAATGRLTDAREWSGAEQDGRHA